ncbi:MAG: sodium:solute symporter, partial [Candidatus Tectomicrobia bacterium]
MNWLKKTCAVVLVMAVPILVHGQDDGPAQQTTVTWHQLGELPGGVGRLGRPFIGIHNDALMLAGRTGTSDSIWIATRDFGSDQNGDGVITPDERPLTWHDTQLTLPGQRAYGASASHELGMIAIGGTDGKSGHNDVVLIRWNADTELASVLVLPGLPSVSVNGGAAVIDDTLYVMAGNDGEGPTGDLYALDLSRIQTDDAGDPLADGDIVKITDKQHDRGGLVNPWQQLPSMPQAQGEHLARGHMAVVAQNDGHGDRLYVIGRQEAPLPAHSEVWAYDPDAEDAATAWMRKGDIRVNGRTVGLSAGAAVPLGQSHVLLLAGPNGDNGRRALSYNAITDAWASYSDAQPVPDQELEAADEVMANVATTTAVRWGDDIILAAGSVNPEVGSPRLWAIKVMGPQLSFGWQNMTVLVVYLLSMVMVGVYFVFKNADTNDYFRGGQNIPWWAAACSIYATMLSSLTYVALPALVYRTDWLVYIGVMMILAVAPLAIYVAMPFFRQIDATSAYEYLSKRFNMPVRLFASGLFTLFHIGRMGIVLALTALALAAVTPLDAWQSVLIMGVLSMIYCTLGGVEAVIWTDTIQTFVLLAGAVVCFAIIIGGVDGGFSGFIASGMADSKFRMVSLDFGPGSITTLSIWVIVLGGIGQNMSSYTADQAVVQRYMTTKDTPAAAKSIWANGIMSVPGALLFFGIGTGLYCFYQSQPEKLDPTIQIDQIFPTFIGTELPIGIAGLIVAGIFAAAQSTVSTSMNSIATTLVTDFMRPFNACRSESAYLNAARALTFLMGVLGTLAGLLFISPEIRSLMEEYFKVIGMFMGALGGLFVLGVTSRKANGWGALVGIFTGVGVMVMVWLMEWADGYLFATIG